MQSKKSLEVLLSKLKSFEKPSLMLEQYATPSNIAAEWIWGMAMKREVSGRVFLDAACGPGILGLALLLLGAKKVYFLDKDESVLKICRENYENIKEEYEVGEAEFVLSDISLFDAEVDAVVQNPPFGTKEGHLDKKFLEKAFSLAPLVYSMHKYSTVKFVEAIARDFNFSITEVWRYEFPIKAAFAFHKKPVKKIDVGLWRMERKRE
ncbi:methyltransferase [Candidatus Woesearchaeota archaeon]|nr:methyltransferase [Candidatus Woesearchaeota archaeon]